MTEVNIRWKLREEQKNKLREGYREVERRRRKITSGQIWITPNYVAYGNRHTIEVHPRREIETIDVVEKDGVHFVDSIEEVDG